MPKLTPKQIDAISRSYIQAAAEVRNFWTKNYQTLSGDEINELRAKQRALENLALELVFDQIDLSLDEIEVGLKDIKSSIARAKAVLKTVKTVKTAVDIAAALLVLGTGIASQSPKGVVKGVSSLTKALKDLEEPKEDGEDK